MHLPPVITDQDCARAHLDAFGITLIAGLLDPGVLGMARAELTQLAERERAAGTALLEDGSAADGRYLAGPNQRVLAVLGKTHGCATLVESPRLIDLIAGAFRASYPLPDELIEQHRLDGVLLSSLSANIANPGGRPMNLHADQGFVPPTTDYPVFINVMWALTDFRAENGATRVVPGSHRLPPAALYAAPPATVPVEVPRGTAIVFDGRLWHGTGANQTTAPRVGLLATYGRPWVRQFENFALTIDDERLRAASPRLRALLGFERWSVFAGAETARLETLV